MKRRFTATQTSTIRDLQRVMTQIKASSLKINQDVMNANVEVVFDRLGKRYVLRCDAWQDSIDNLRAIGLTIQYLYRAIESWGVKIEESRFNEIFDQIFAGLIATPDDSVLMIGDGRAQWYDVLGVKPDADAVAIKNAFRALAKVHHPDAGGNKDDFNRLRDAYDKGLAQLKSK